MTGSEFKRTEEWELIQAKLREQLIIAIDSALAATNFGDKEYNRGYADAVKDFLVLPDAVLPKSTDSDIIELTEEDASLGHLYMINKPNKELY